MLILGIDPGSRKSGYGLIDFDQKNFRYIDSGVIHYDSKKEIIVRLKEIYETSLELVNKFKPDEIAFESLILVKSPTSLMKLAQARGAIISACHKNPNQKVFEYSPNLIKSSVSGHGHADKTSIQKMLSLTLGQRKFSTDDESDALAIAICHAINRNRVIASGKGKSARSNGMASSLSHKIKESHL